MKGNQEIMAGKATKRKTQKRKQAHLGRGRLEYIEGEEMTRKIPGALTRMWQARKRGERLRGKPQQAWEVCSQNVVYGGEKNRMRNGRYDNYDERQR